jgi:hypothetical protein
MDRAGFLLAATYAVTGKSPRITGRLEPEIPALMQNSRYARFFIEHPHTFSSFFHQ